MAVLGSKTTIRRMSAENRKRMAEYAAFSLAIADAVSSSTRLTSRS